MPVAILMLRQRQDPHRSSATSSVSQYTVEQSRGCFVGRMLPRVATNLPLSLQRFHFLSKETGPGAGLFLPGRLRPRRCPQLMRRRPLAALYRRRFAAACILARPLPTDYKLYVCKGVLAAKPIIYAVRCACAR
jgi:hypothetical protein